MDLKNIKILLAIFATTLIFCSDGKMTHQKNIPRVIFNSDGCSLTLSVCEPPMTVKQLCRVIDELENTDVDVFAWCPQLGGDSFTYPTKVAEIAYGGDLYPEIDWDKYHFRMKQQAQNVRAIIDAGLDPIHILSERTHEIGKKFWVTLRMNDQHEDDVKRFGVKISQFKKNNPNSLIGPDFRPGVGAYCDKYGFSYTWNYADEKVQEHLLAIIEELCRNYNIDGFELDFMRGPWYFKKGKEKAGIPIMTRFVRQVHSLTSQIAKQKNHEFTLSFRIPPTVDEALSKGLDVATWIKQELADIFIPMDGGYLDANVDITDFVEHTKGTNCIIAGGLEPYVRVYGHADLAMLSATTLSFYEQGARSIYLFNFDCHRIKRAKKGPAGLHYGDYVDSEVQFLNMAGHPEKLAICDKRYFITNDMKSQSAKDGSTKQLPVKLNAHVSLHFFVGDDVEKNEKKGLLDSTFLDIILKGDKKSPGNLNFVLNEKMLENFKTPNLNIKNGNINIRFQDVPLQKGLNTLSILRKNTADVSNITIQQIEAIISY